MMTSYKTSNVSCPKTVAVITHKQWLFACILMGVSFSSMGATPGWFQTIVSSCEAGATQDCLSAAVALKKGELNGKKINKDPGRSKYYADKAIRAGDQNCKQGDSLDCYTIGLLYFEGGGVIPTNIPRGLDYLQRSCRGGYKKACDWLDASGLNM